MKMQQFSLYYDDRKIHVSTVQENIDFALKIRSYENQLYLLSGCQRLYRGYLNAQTDSSTLELHVIRSEVVDIDIFDKTLYIVDKSGQVYYCAIANLVDTKDDIWTEIVVDDAKTNCPVAIEKIKNNSFGTIFVTTEQELYGSGNYGILDSKQPKKIECFSGLKILDIAGGIDFFVVLTYRDEHVIFQDENDNLSTSSSTDSRRECSSRTEITEICNNGNDGKLLKRNETTEYNLVENDEKIENGVDCDTIRKENEWANVDLNFRYDTSKADSRQILRQLISSGSNLIQTNVFSFGQHNNGQLGTGDHIKRTSLNLVLNLNGIGVCAVSCGKEHSAATTFDGRIFQWGSNSHNQISSISEVYSVSAPKSLAKDSSCLEVQCSQNRTVLLNRSLQITDMCKNSRNYEFFTTEAKMQSIANIKSRLPTVLVSDNFFLQNHNTFLVQYGLMLSTFQHNVRSYIDRLKHIKFIRKNVVKRMSFSIEMDLLCQSYIDLVNILAICLETTNQFYRQEIDFYGLEYVKHSCEISDVFRVYTKHYCNITSTNCWDEIAKVCHNLKFELQSETEIQKIFFDPFNFVFNTIRFLEALMKEVSESKELEIKLGQWKKLSEFTNTEFALGKKTQQFWQKHEKNAMLLRLRQTHRRVILHSTEKPLKIATGGKFTSNLFVLFSDYFVQVNSCIMTYPLTTLWLRPENLKLHISVPEREFTLIAKDADTKTVWYESLRAAINNALGFDFVDEMPSLRCAVYRFSDKHPNYGGVVCHGNWDQSVMHGFCHLEYPDGRTYCGDLYYGEISGQGQLTTPSVGIYEGAFRKGKFNGFGVYEMANNVIYEGYFRDGLFHGHGSLQTKQYTYIGEFRFNVKHGYGILEDFFSGEKYMGMFENDKRNGPALLIRGNNDYFFATYVNDDIRGVGTAVFHNGKYYEGELTLNGPNGKGTFYIPLSEILYKYIVDEEDTAMKGNVLTGILAGTWDEIAIKDGSFVFDKEFPKQPTIKDNCTVNNNLKWCSLFKDWEHDVFGDISLSDTVLVRENISINYANAKNKHKSDENKWAKYSNFYMKNIMLETNKFSESFKKSSSSGKIATQSSLNIKMSSLSLNAYSNGSLLDGDGSTSANKILLPKETPIFSSFLSLKIPKANSVQFEPQSSSSSLNKDINTNESNLSSGQRSPSNLSSGSDDIQRKISKFPFSSSFGVNSLTEDDLCEIKDYLLQAFRDADHPLGLLVHKLSKCFHTSYGCWKSKPNANICRLAIDEFRSLSERIYSYVQKIFPALSKTDSEEAGGQFVSHINLLYPMILNEEIYSILLVLYANKFSKTNERYQKRITQCRQISDEDLAAKLLDRKCILSMKQLQPVINSFKQISEKYSPQDMIDNMVLTIQLLVNCGQNQEPAIKFETDDLLPLIIFTILRADVPHLGAELALIEDLQDENDDKCRSDQRAFCYINIKAAYQYIIGDNFL